MSDYAVVISARMGSNRLPGKALASYCPDGTPNLEQIVRRWQASRRNPDIVVATTFLPEDAPIRALCKRIGVACSEGPVDDVVTRMDGTLRGFARNAKWVARALADNPLVEVGLADWRLDVMRETKADGLWYLGDESKLTYAATTDVWSREAWERIAQGSSGSQREHPGTYFWENLGKFNVVGLHLPPQEYVTPMRTELDTEADLAMFRALWGGASQYITGVLPTLWALDYMTTHPEIPKLNAEVELKTQTRPHWGKGMSWICDGCRKQAGAVIAGDLEVRCPRCGKPKKFYAKVKPDKKRAFG